MYISLRYVDFPTTAIHFVKLKLMHTVIITEPVTDSSLALLLTDLGTVVLFTERTTVFIRNLETAVLVQFFFDSLNEQEFARKTS